MNASRSSWVTNDLDLEEGGEVCSDQVRKNMRIMILTCGTRNQEKKYEDRNNSLD